MLRVHCTKAGNGTSILTSEWGRYISECIFSAAWRKHLYFAVFPLTAFLPEADSQPGTCPPFHPHINEVMKGCRLGELHFLGGGERNNDCFFHTRLGKEGSYLVVVLAEAPP